MADEQGVTIIGGIETEVRGLAKDVAELKGAFGQMDKRLSSLEAALRQEIGGLRQEMRQEIGDLRKDNRQSFNWMVGMWITTILAILTMSLTILSRIR